MAQASLNTSGETLPDPPLGLEALCLVSFINGRSWVGRVPPSTRVTIGRSTDADLFVDDPSISRVHAAIHTHDVGSTRGCEIEDLGSRNGTTIRGERIAPHVRVPLGLGDSALFGRVPMVLANDRRADAERAPTKFHFGGAAMRGVLEMADRVAAGNIAVLVLGETGVGKEVLAERLHAKSPRRGGPLVRLNCAALPEALLESELFGHERGAFTGAQQTKIGILESAAKGTVFLDEIGELAMSLQAKVLRAIDEKQILRLGSVTPRPIDVRFITATNRDLPSEIRKERFRQDLFYRIAGVKLEIPPLRDRRDEIPELARLFVARAASELGRAAPRVGEDVLRALARHAWPGNIRELRNVVDRAVLLCSGGALSTADLGLTPSDATLAEEALPPSVPPPSAVGPASSERLRSRLAGVERTEIVEALERCAGNQTRAAKELGIPRATFVKRLDAYGLARPRKK